MEFLYPLFISFIMVFIAELGDKTQLLVLSFSGGVKYRNIILGIAIRFIFQPWYSNTLSEAELVF